LIQPLAELLGALEIREHVPQIEVAVADNATALVLRVLRVPSEQDRRKLQDFAARHAVRLYLQTGGLESVAELTIGSDEGAAIPPSPTTPLNYTLPAFGLTLEFTPTDFLQVNGVLNQALVSRAVELLRPTPGCTVLDLYCGLGNFTLALAKSAGHVVGVEGEAGLVARARQNALRNGRSK